MTSTRNKNSLGDYTLENNENMYALQNFTFDGRIYSTNLLPGNGLLPCSMPLSILSNNQADIETNLFGIGSTNLVFPIVKQRQPDINNFRNLFLSICILYL